MLADEDVGGRKSQKAKELGFVLCDRLTLWCNESLLMLSIASSSRVAIKLRYLFLHSE